MSKLGADAIFVCNGRERAATIVKDCGGGTVNLMVFGADIDEKPVQLETSVLVFAPDGEVGMTRYWLPIERDNARDALMAHDALVNLIDSRIEKMLDGAPEEADTQDIPLLRKTPAYQKWVDDGKPTPDEDTE